MIRPMAHALREESSRVRAWYNLVADAFVRRYEGDQGWYLARCEEDLLHRFVAFQDRIVLDLGSGAGRLLPRLAPMARRVLAADLSEALLARAPRTPRASLLQMNALDLALGGESVDVVVSLGLFEYVSDLEPFFKEVARVLKPGGPFAFTYHQLAAYRQPRPEAPEMPYFGRTVAERSAYWSKRRHTSTAVRAALIRTGFVQSSAHRTFFRASGWLEALSCRLGPHAPVGAALRGLALETERILGRRLAPITRHSTGNVLVVALKEY